MGTLEQAASQCRGVEFLEGGEKKDFGAENLKRVQEFQSRLKALPGPDGMMGFTKPKIDEQAYKRALEARLSDIDRTNTTTAYVGCSEADNTIRQALGLKGYEDIQKYIKSAPAQAPLNVQKSQDSSSVFDTLANRGRYIDDKVRKATQ